MNQGQIDSGMVNDEGLCGKPSYTIANGAGCNLIEVVVLALIIWILATLLSPVLAKVRAKAQAASCANRVMQWGLAFQLLRSRLPWLALYHEALGVHRL
ncbi:MAG: hypothetical protein ABSA12_10990 [Verrucomicrobiia bacterium]|jgi:hypothetical protein